MAKTAELAIIGKLANPPEPLKTGVALHVTVEDLGKTDGQIGEAWVRAIAFGDVAQIAMATFDQGDTVFLRGRPTLDRWADKYSGTQKSGLSLIVEQAVRLGTDLRPPKPEPEQRKPQREPTPAESAQARPRARDLPYGMPKGPKYYEAVRIRHEPRCDDWQAPLNWTDTGVAFGSSA